MVIDKTEKKIYYFYRMRNKTFLRVFVVYGMHIWLLIILCNVVIFYSFRFFINASTTRTAGVEKPAEIIISPSAAIKIPIPIPTAAGPVVNLSFSLPGIGTNGGNLKPSHANRNVNIYLYDSDVNISDKNVKPAYIIKTQAAYDGNPNSPTYTYFVNKYIDLGAIKDGSYQIAIQTFQSLRQLIKSSNPNSLSGQLFDLSDKHFFVLPPQEMITGDIYSSPNNGNNMDINDYTMLINCYNVQISSLKCSNTMSADLDDNGIVDGIDYNIMLANFLTLMSLGLPAPTISLPSPEIPINISQIISTPKQKDVRPTPVQRLISRSDSFGAVNIFVLFILALGIIGVINYKFHLLNMLFPKENDDQKATKRSSLDQAGNITSPTGVTEKSGYLKKISFDVRTNGAWVTLADTAGVTRGFYPKADITDGFVKIKGTMKKDEEDKPYIYITQLEAED